MTQTKYLLFDLDNTLYRESSDMGKAISKRMTSFVANLLNISFDEALIRRRTNIRSHGSTMKWLEWEISKDYETGKNSDLAPLAKQSGHNIQSYFRENLDSTLKAFREDFLLAVHPEKPEEHIVRDEKLEKILKQIKLPKAILTNSPIEHAQRVLKHLNIEKHFAKIIDIRFNNFTGKPHKIAYENTLKSLGWKAKETLFIDDVVAYGTAFMELGGQFLLIDEFQRKKLPSQDICTIQSLEELELKRPELFEDIG